MEGEPHTKPTDRVGNKDECGPIMKKAVTQTLTVKSEIHNLNLQCMADIVMVFLTESISLDQLLDFQQSSGDRDI